MGLFDNPIFSSITGMLRSAMSSAGNLATIEPDPATTQKIPEVAKPYGEPEVSTIEQTHAEVPIVIDKKVRTKYRDAWIKATRDPKLPIVEVVVHGTGGGRSVEGLLNWMYTDGRPGYKKNIGFFHYAIGRGDKGEKDGLIVNVLDPEYWTYHSTCYKHDYQTIGVELLNTSLSNRDPFTDAQYDSLFKLIFDYLMPLYPTITRITGHRYNIWRWNTEAKAKENDKNCPGNFDWSRVDKELSKRGFAFDSDGPMCKYNIAKKKTVGIKKSDA
jgi:hypothetical protein